MHELTVAQRLLDRALSAAEDHGADEIATLTVELGAATHIAADQIAFCIEAVAEGTPAADATIEFERVQPRGQCECGWQGTLPSISDAQPAPSVRCPECGSRVTLTAGRECRLASIDVPENRQTEP
jgi:hydrogenase nickel incorporation protein HypA/HybF